MADFQDEVSRACERNGIDPDSDLASELRSSIWAVAGNDYSDQRDYKLDRFLKLQKSNPRFADSLVKPKPKAEKKPEPHLEACIQLTTTQFEETARTGKLG